MRLSQAALLLSAAIAGAAEPGFRIDAGASLSVEFGGPGSEEASAFAAAELQRYAGGMLQLRVRSHLTRRNWPDRLCRIRLGTAPADLTQTRLDPGGFEAEAGDNTLTFTAGSALGLLAAVYVCLIDIRGIVG